MSETSRISEKQALSKSIDEARDCLDTWTREVVAWHFDPDSGCPFWLDYAQRIDWDPRKEIQCFNDLHRFGLFQDDWLRGGPVRRWVPKGFSDKRIYVFETGGSTGVPKSRINIDDFRVDYTMFSNTLDDASFPPGSNWLMLGPSGPRRLRLAIEHLAQERGGICFCVDMDPRWVIQLIKHGHLDALDDYKEHVVRQGLTLLRAHSDIECLFTTPKLLEALCEKISLRKVGIKGIFCGGTQMTAQFHRFAREELLEGAEFAPTYGNTLMGLACHKPFDPADNYIITYYSPQPRAVLQIVESDNSEQVVEFGSRGRVKLTTLTKEFFMPGFLERDEAIRARPITKYPWDGVADVRPFGQLETNVVEGVY